MKSLKYLKSLLLIIPFNALAHPGHEEITGVVGSYQVVAVIVVSLAALAIYFKSARRH